MGRPKRKTLAPVTFAVLIIISVFLTVSPQISPALPSYEKLFCLLRLKNKDSGDRIIFIDVGQGDCALIISDGHSALLDCGTGKDDGHRITEKLKDQDIESLDYLIISHPHSDHLGGGAAVMNTLPVGKLLMPGTAPADKEELEVYTGFLYTAEAKAIPVSHLSSGDRYSLGNFMLDVLYCDTAAEGENDCSAVIKATAGEYSVLFTGDIGVKTEYVLMAERTDISADILKVAHHGSAASSSERFMYLTSPKLAVISVGENRYGHPAKQTADRIEAVGAGLLRTDVSGDITVFFKKDLPVKTER